MSICSNEQEIQISNACIFEGHLYIRTEKKKWKWRLFRFDGTQLTCLKKADLIEWTIDVSSIESISLLRKAKRPAMCFSIQTLSQKRRVFKAAKQKDLERWLFVLTRMWKFTQDQQIQICQQNPSVYDTKPVLLLSSEKIHVIDEWRKSLAELLAYDPNIKRHPPPIEPIPEDDNLSIFTDMTSVSRRRVKKVVRRSSRRSTKIMPLLEETSTLKRRRSDEVRHWMGKPNVQSQKKNNEKKQEKRSSMPIIKTREEEEEEMSLAELLYKLNLTGQAPIRHCSAFVPPVIPPYTHHHPF